MNLTIIIAASTITLGLITLAIITALKMQKTQVGLEQGLNSALVERLISKNVELYFRGRVEMWMIMSKICKHRDGKRCSDATQKLYPMCTLENCSQRILRHDTTIK